ncbi:MAG: polyprenyl diphosphate synthase [Oscillospiraceae bacterium]|nr:polyprenyl diphosphate synthase [Oscillospiraceae bacterium]
MRIRKRNTPLIGIDPQNLPKHIGIIMDGNGRWARKRGLPRSLGHIAGFSETTRSVIYYCRDIGVKHITLYAFSTENWRRAEEEVLGIFKLMEKFLREVIEKAEVEQSRIRFFGDLSRVPAHLFALVEEAQVVTAQYTRANLNICFNYGGRDEVVRAVRNIAKNVALQDITEAMISEHLDSAGQPDPDLIIRPGGEHRTSNFLMWQAVYAEYYFTETLWPDFTPAEIDKAILAYQKRDRRKGGAV